VCRGFCSCVRYDYLFAMRIRGTSARGEREDQDDGGDAGAPLFLQDGS